MKKNLFLALVIVGLLIAAAIFYFGVFTYYQEISSQETTLNTNHEAMDRIMAEKSAQPSREWIAQRQKYIEWLDREISECRNYYMEMDNGLEKWFGDLPRGKDGIPAEGDFRARYFREKDAWIKQLKDKKVYESGEDESAESVSDEGKNLGFGEPKADNIQRLQKQFWIQEKLFADMLASKAVKCEKVNFHDSKKDIKFQYGTMIPFNLTVLIQNKDVPVFVGNILRFPDIKDWAHLPVLIKDISVSRVIDDVNALGEIKRLNKAIPESQKSTYKPEPIKAPLSRLIIEGEVIDFDFSVEPAEPVQKKDKPKKKPKDKKSVKPPKEDDIKDSNN